MADSTGSEIHREGVDHIKENSGISSTSNSGVDESTAGTTSSSGGVVNTFKSYLGYGGQGQQEQLGSAGEGGRGASSVTETPGSAGDPNAAAAATDQSVSGSRSNPIGATPGTAGSTDPSPATDQSVSSRSNQVGATPGTSGSMNPSNAATDESVSSSTASRTSDPAQQDTHMDVAKTTQPADAVTDHSTGGDTEERRSVSAASHKGEGSSGPTGKARENESAIPTAGGQKLGEKHWGESKMVPDNPKPSETEKVSSAEGQPTQETADNTARNTGGAAAPGSPDSGEGKEKITDKIKDKLHIGKSS